MGNLNEKGNRHFLGLYKMLMEKRIKNAEEGTPVLVKPDYDLIELRLGLRRQDAWRHLREMCRLGIIKKANMDGERGEMIYQIGTYEQEKSKFPKPTYWVQNTPDMVKALTEFDANRELRRK
jgi:hypothetical protein